MGPIRASLAVVFLASLVPFAAAEAFGGGQQDESATHDEAWLGSQEPEQGQRPEPDPEQVQPTAEELKFINLTNQERSKLGLSQLELDPLLVKVARKYSKFMAENKHFGHTAPSGPRTPMDRYLEALDRKPDYAVVGENLFYCTVVDVARGHQAFMHSPTHRDNIVFPRYRKMGVGIYINERGEFWVTEMFLSTEDPNKSR